MQESLEAESGVSQNEEDILITKGKRPKGTKRYVPQKNSVAYALLLTLYRGIDKGSDFMRKQELIDAAEASGLSRVPIAPEKGKGKPSREQWYSGWNCMKTLVTKGLVLKSSCPAKYMLTEEGKEVACDCLSRSGEDNITNTREIKNTDTNIDSDVEVTNADIVEDVTMGSVNLCLPKKSLDRGLSVPKFGPGSARANINFLAMPPLLFGERFVEAYEVILILDNREQFAIQGSRSQKLIENITTQFQIQIKVRRLPVGDAIWIAKHKSLGSEYVLDFIIERKKIDDLRSSIRDNRYKDQKLRLLRCGLKKLIYVVEGDPNSSEAAESIKTACLTTEILEGFDVQRTSGLGDTLRKYGFLTQAIAQFYNSLSLEHEKDSLVICPAYDEFIKRCHTLEKMTVSDVFAIQLMQVPQVTEEIADAVLDLYPTLLSLARAYSLLEGDIRVQEEMLKNQSNNTISVAASRNIFQLVWGS